MTLVEEPVSRAVLREGGTASSRLGSLDAFRGLTIALMILVNNPGSWSHVYPPLKHAEWHGCTPTDLVFPFFLFIVGVAIPFAQSARLKRLRPEQSRGALMPGIVRRTLILFALGLLLASIPTRLNPGNGILDPQDLRLLGVLQRIALCYLPAALLALYFGWRVHVLVAIALMTIYSILVLAVPVPGRGAGDLSIEGNLAAYVDAKVLENHCYQHPPQHAHFWEPEGLLSTLPAIATTLLGLLAGLWLRAPRDDADKAAGLLVAGVLCAAAGYALDGILMPINKGLWTPSYVLYTGGLALLALGTCYWLIDVKRYRAWSRPFVIFGMNAIAIFVLSAIIARLLSIRVDVNGSAKALKTIVYGRAFEPLGMNPLNTSLLYAIAFVMMMFAIAWAMHRKRIYLRV